MKTFSAISILLLTCQIFCACESDVTEQSSSTGTDTASLEDTMRNPDDYTDDTQVEFDLESSLGASFSYDELIEQNLGKVIVVDFWASWCKPCKEEMPYLKEMIAEIAQDDLVVLTISIDKKKEDWENEISIEDSPVEDLSYLMIDYENSPIAKQFNVSLIPRYMVYDKTGQLTHEVAPRPSSGDLKPILLELLGQ